MSTTPAVAPAFLRVPRLATFTIVGVVTAAVDVAVLVAGREVLGLSLALAAGAGWACGTALNFTAHRRWTFAGSRGSLAADSTRYGALVVANLVGAVVAVPLLAAAGMPYLLARVTGFALLLLVNFVACRRWVFRD